MPDLLIAQLINSKEKRRKENADRSNKYSSSETPNDNFLPGKRKPQILIIEHLQNSIHSQKVLFIAYTLKKIIC